MRMRQEVRNIKRHERAAHPLRPPLDCLGCGQLVGADARASPRGGFASTSQIESETKVRGQQDREPVPATANVKSRPLRRCSP